MMNAAAAHQYHNRSGAYDLVAFSVHKGKLSELKRKQEERVQNAKSPSQSSVDPEDKLELDGASQKS